MQAESRHAKRTAAAARADSAAARCGAAPAALPASRTAVRNAWLDLVQPAFADNDSAYFTGTYSDAYGFDHGLMLVRNVHADFRRFLERWDVTERYIVGVEAHQFRDILHLHAVIEGPFSEYDRNRLKAAWQADRGYARVLPVQDRCTAYVTKYALKGDTESFEWRLT